jgi:ABC-type Fe3+/spermidine/putrescine transport system ATPase subunit
VSVEPAIRCVGVDIAYDDRVVVRGLDLAIAPGEMVVLLGPSGSGKTTILSAIAGFFPIRGGEIRLSGRLVAAADRHEPPNRRDVAVVFQDYALWPHLSAVETVRYPLQRRGLGGTEAGREASSVLERLGIAALADRRPSEMSGGEQQRVGLGRALARHAAVQLFDEPTAHLDAALRERLLVEIADGRRSSGAAGVYATHDTAEALAIADRVVLIRDGRVAQVGTPREVYEAPVDLWSARLTGRASEISAELTGWNGGRPDLLVGGVHVRPEADPGSTGAGASRAGRMVALVRPDWVGLDGPLPGTVVQVQYRGTHTDYVLTTPVGEVAVRRIGPPVASSGDPIGWRLNRVRLLDL